MLAPADAQLGRTRTRQLIGYSVLSLDRRTVITPFTREKVIESLPGRYAVTGVITVPDDGAVIQWGLKDEPIAEEVIAPAPPAPPAQPVPPVPTASAIAEAVGANVARTMATNNSNVVKEIAAMRRLLDRAVERISSMSSSTEAAAELSALRGAMAKVLGVPVAMLPSRSAPRPAPVGEMQGQPVDAATQAKLRQTLGELDAFIALMEAN